jgi:hypothetical protein
MRKSRDNCSRKYLRQATISTRLHCEIFHAAINLQTRQNFARNNLPAPPRFSIGSGIIGDATLRIGYGLRKLELSFSYYVTAFLARP